MKSQAVEKEESVGGELVDMSQFFTMLSDFLNGKYTEQKITEICSLLPFSEEKRNDLAVDYLLFRIGRKK